MATASPAPAVASERDLRLDLFRGVALWLIFLDHIPENVANWFTIRNYGFSDATEIFIFISGYTAAFVYGRAMRERGFLLSSARILKRAWQIYVAHIFLFTIFMAEIAYVAATFDNPLYAEEMKILDFLKQPDVTIFQALLLKFKPVNMDVLPLYIVLLLLFPPMLQLLLRSPNFALAGSALLYALTWKFDFNLPAYPNGVWFFNPFAWQFIMAIGIAAGLAMQQNRLVRSKPLFILASVVVFAGAFVVTNGFGLSFGVRDAVYNWLDLDKTNLGLGRLIHFLGLAYFIYCLGISPKLASLRVLQPLIVLGRHSLLVFFLLSLVAAFGQVLLLTGHNALWIQVALLVGGVSFFYAAARFSEAEKAAGGPVMVRG